MPEDQGKLWRISGNVPDEMNTEIESFARKFGMRKTSFISFLIILGLQAFKRTYAPESLLSPAQLVDIIKAAEEKGIDVKGLKNG